MAHQRRNQLDRINQINEELNHIVRGKLRNRGHIKLKMGHSQQQQLQQIYTWYIVNIHDGNQRVHAQTQNGSKCAVHTIINNDIDKNPGQCKP